ncbi:vomeronasal type-1 receptor 4-like [Grammomys surdaster]|uniref:vomeronasal type-1 receptor 4-like n=1 Tax=Grammomys surdaster TaxID=491861 RepID=UPI0010A0B3C3|nr:vomeronasal type-1 receptor 4-like [Grammomys surdaster]
MPSHRMEFWNMTIKIIFLLQITTGVLGNALFLIFYLVYNIEHILKPTDMILMHIMASNVLIVISTGVPNTLVAFGLKKFLNDFGCEIILYIQRVGRSMSISTTCFLSVFQAITISHRESCCKDQKTKAAKYIGCSIFLLWVLSMIIHFIFLVYILVKRNNKNMTRTRNFEYCSTGGQSEITDLLYGMLVVCPEIFFSVLIAWSSGSMIVILYRHKQRVQHIHSSHVSRRNSPESRATQNILVLVSTFLAFYTVSSVLQGCIALLYHHNWWLVNITRLTSLCFPSLGPFVLMSQSLSPFTVCCLTAHHICDSTRPPHFQDLNSQALCLCNTFSVGHRPRADVRAVLGAVTSTGGSTLHYKRLQSPESGDAQTLRARWDAGGHKQKWAGSVPGTVAQRECRSVWGHSGNHGSQEEVSRGSLALSHSRPVAWVLAYTMSTGFQETREND